MLYFHGISSGVLCVIFGIYEKLLDSFLNFFKDMKNNFKFLFPIFIGVGIGVLVFSNVLNYLLINFPIQTQSIFIGLILGCIPSLFKDVNTKTPIRKSYFLFTIVAFLIGVLSVYLEKNINFSDTFNFNYLYLIFSGFAMSIGIVVPGVSSTIILMLLGVYNLYLTGISNIYLPTLIPMFLGLLIGCFVFMKLTKFLLDNFYAQTFYSIIGFTLGSIFVLLPSFSFDILGFVAILCVSLGFLIGNSFKNYN